MWMNEPEIDETVEMTAQAAPQFSKYAKYLSDWRDVVNANSDGWAHWKGGTRPAETLMALLQSVKDKIRGRGNFRTDEAPMPTDAQFKKALSAIRAAATKHKLTAPTLEGDAPETKAKAVEALTAEEFVSVAERHGRDSEPDHEVGDLQSFFRAAYNLLTPDQRKAFLGSEAVRETIDSSLVLDDPLPEDADAAVTALREALKPRGRSPGR